MDIKDKQKYLKMAKEDIKKRKWGWRVIFSGLVSVVILLILGVPLKLVIGIPTILIGLGSVILRESEQKWKKAVKEFQDRRRTEELAGIKMSLGQLHEDLEDINKKLEKD